MRHVALLIETSGSYGRGLLRGVARYNREQGGWSTYFQPHGLGDAPPAWLRTWEGDGILARIDSRRVAGVIARLRVPVVNLRGTVRGLRFPYVGLDHEHAAQLAAEHLLERGLRHFGFCGRRRGEHPGLDERAEAFRRSVTRGGGTCDVFNPTSTRSDWERDQEQLARWIRSLPKPVGVMAANDEHGLQVLDACRRCDAGVPDEVAVIGVDNDEFLCELSIPPLSSVDVNAEQIGYAAAKLLDRVMGGDRVPARISRIPARGVVVRRSTDVIACEDPDVAEAVRFIRARACNGVHVGDVLRHVGLSRGTLQARMKRLLGRTVHQEMDRVRLDRARQLLLSDSMSVKQIARVSGFGTAPYLTRVFRKATGETPASFRAKRK